MKKTHQFVFYRISFAFTLVFTWLACFVFAQEHSEQAKAAGEHGAKQAAEGSGLLQTLGIDPKVIAIQFVGFIFLFFVLKKLLFERIIEHVQKRKDDISTAFETMEQERAEIERLKEEYKKHLEKIEDEGREVIAKAIKEAQQHKQELLDEAKAEHDKLVEKAKREIELEKEKVLVTIQEEVANLTILCAEKVIGETLDETKHKRLVLDVISDIGKARH